MTEQDTFLKLKQTPIKEVSELLWLSYLSESTPRKLMRYLDKDEKFAGRDAVLQEHGWTIDSYCAAVTSHMIK